MGTQLGGLADLLFCSAGFAYKAGLCSGRANYRLRTQHAGVQVLAATKQLTQGLSEFRRFEKLTIVRSITRPRWALHFPDASEILASVILSNTQLLDCEVQIGNPGKMKRENSGLRRLLILGGSSTCMAHEAERILIFRTFKISNPLPRAAFKPLVFQP